MSERFENETLRQQRKARQEFLELKKMQQGQMDAGPKPSEIAVMPKTPIEKFKNIWFHDKWFIIGGVLLTVVIAFMVAQCAGRTEYDFNIVLYAYNAVDEDDCEKMAEYFTPLCEDINGDGEVNVKVTNCSFSYENTNPQYRQTCMTKVQAILVSDASALLFITDDKAYDQLSNLGDGYSIFEDEPIALGENFYKAVQSDEIFPLPEGLKICSRIVDGTVIDGDKNIQRYYTQSKKILSFISENN